MSKGGDIDLEWRVWISVYLLRLIIWLWRGGIAWTRNHIIWGE